ncbi:hypothetical protein [Sphaerisporangium corydalis]|uniref:hypothetical protein n=1 Tax=Sphaerisporangium corydalis TaxID=1441875 RepID=UPI0021D25172|nr:hypothetical protein [Sphaerisporangium corydalis]
MDGSGPGGAPLPPVRPRFWTAEAAPTATSSAPAHTSTGPYVPPPAFPATPPDAVVPEASSGLVHGVRLAAGVTLLLEGRAPSAGDVAALREAAAPLLAALRDRNLDDLDRSPSEGMQA